MRVLGIDGGFASMGIAVLELTPDQELLRDVYVVRTQKSDRKLQVLAGDDTARRGRELAHHVGLAITSQSPGAIVIESPSWPRNAGVAAKLGVAFGVVYALAEKHGLPLLQVSPQQVKKSLCGRKDAAKEDIIAAVEARFPSVTWPSQKGLWEHAADSIAVVLAGLDSDVIRAVRRAA